MKYHTIVYFILLLFVVSYTTCIHCVYNLRTINVKNLHLTMFQLIIVAGGTDAEMKMLFGWLNQTINYASSLGLAS